MAAKDKKIKFPNLSENARTLYNKVMVGIPSSTEGESDPITPREHVPAYNLSGEAKKKLMLEVIPDTLAIKLGISREEALQILNGKDVKLPDNILKKDALPLGRE
ncbi:hypothetical protein HYV64_02545 [Candidatus Shapirobacteria bacterium]|nr:hypothetical protein [Candidatus Shapirobacteria bacterium]